MQLSLDSKLDFGFEWDSYHQNIAIMGEAQSGKTNAALVIAKILTLNGFNVVIRDVHRRFSRLDPACIKKTLYDIKGVGLEIFQPDNDTSELFIDFCSLIASFYNCVVIIDELHNDANKYRSNKHLEFFCRNCNNRGCSYLAIFQRPAEVPSFILHNAHHKFCFRFELPTDIDYMKKWIGVDVERFTSEFDPIEKYHCFYKAAGMRPKEMMFPEFK